VEAPSGERLLGKGRHGVLCTLNCVIHALKWFVPCNALYKCSAFLLALQIDKQTPDRQHLMTIEKPCTATFRWKGQWWVVVIDDHVRYCAEVHFVHFNSGMLAVCIVLVHITTVTTKGVQTAISMSWVQSNERTPTIRSTVVHFTSRTAQSIISVNISTNLIRKYSEINGTSNYRYILRNAVVPIPFP